MVATARDHDAQTTYSRSYTKYTRNYSATRTATNHTPYFSRHLSGFSLPTFTYPPRHDYLPRTNRFYDSRYALHEIDAGYVTAPRTMPVHYHERFDYDASTLERQRRHLYENRRYYSQYDLRTQSAMAREAPPLRYGDATSSLPRPRPTSTGYSRRDSSYEQSYGASRREIFDAESKKHLVK